MRRFPNLALLRTFEAAARLESFSAAAAELNLTPSAVSHQIKELEEYVGKPLFIRLHRKVALTTESKSFSTRLSGQFDAMEQAWQELLSPTTQHELVVHCAPSFATHWLGPRIRQLMALYPQIRLTILSDAEPVDLVKRREVDVIVSYCGYLQREELSTFPLGMDEFVPMCSPELRSSYSSDEQAILQATPIESRGSCLSWPAWYGMVGLRQPGTTPLYLDRLSMKIAAAVDGLGVVLESAVLARAELQSGRLVKLPGVSGGAVARASHFVSVRTRELDSARITLFLDWIRQEWENSLPA